MADKHLTELAWKMLAKKNNVTDPTLGKALAKFGQVKDDDLDGRLAALAEVKKHATTLKAANKKLKEVTDYLDDVTQEADKTRQTLEQVKKTKDAAGDKGEDDDSGDLAGALAKVKTGAELQFAACPGKPFMVALAKTIGGKHKKALTEKNGGSTFLTGTCLFEANAHTFVLQRVQGGLAKKLKGALQAQTGKSYKVRVRGLDDGQVLDDETDRDEEGTSTGAPQTDAEQFAQRYAALEPAIAQALKDNRGDVGKLRAVSAFAQGKAEAGDYAKGLQALGQIEQLLKAAGGPLAPAASLAAWQQARTAVVGRLRTLAAKVAAVNHPQNRDAVVEVSAVIKNLTADPSTRKQVLELERWLTTDAVVADVCAMDFDMREELTAALEGLKTQLPA